jgi:hypothetical protein
MQTMKYILVKWIHNFVDEPVLLYSELDDSRFETRKVEIFSDGEIGYASEAEEFGTTRLGIEPVPSIFEIAKDPEFEPKEITQEEFEKIWSNRQKENK